MELIGVDTQRAYDQIREMIITLKLAPGAIVDEQVLSDEINMGAAPIREALKLLVHDNLIEVAKHRGVYVSSINPEDLQYLSEVRVLLESYTARLAAERATQDDIIILEALIDEQKDIPVQDKQAWFDIDHKLHQAIAAAARNHYLIKSLEYYFGLSLRLWNFILPKIDFLSLAVQEHAELIESIRNKQPDKAEKIMASHVKDFYSRVHEILDEE